MRYRFLTCDVFTDRRFGGNQLAVLPEAEGLSTERMQLIAREFNYSETTFVLPPDDPAHLARVRIFTPRSELPFAGHPTVGTALALTWLGRAPTAGRFILEEGAGLVPIEVSEDVAEFTAPGAPEYGSLVEAGPIATALGLNPAEVKAGASLPCVASHGVPFLLVELASLAALGHARLTGGSEPGAAGGEGIFLFTHDVGDAPADLRARMFAPSHGIPEDPATGSAAAALAGLLGAAAGLDEGWRRWRIAQGWEIGRPSLIDVRARREGGRVAEVRVGGRAVAVAEGTIEVEA
jgi:trans-2,3-dihydro-3-hydroxyanthranilate isomerase